MELNKITNNCFDIMTKKNTFVFCDFRSIIEILEPMEQFYYEEKLQVLKR